ncbi:unnamed protein product [Scytosiphon promiscuus]
MPSPHVAARGVHRHPGLPNANGRGRVLSSTTVIAPAPMAEGSHLPVAPSASSSPIDLSDSGGSRPRSAAAASCGGGGDSGSSAGGAAGSADERGRGAPEPGLEILRENPPKYDRDYDMNELHAEFMRRAGKTRPVIYGPKEAHQISRLSKLTKKQAATYLRTWDEWNTEEGGEMWFKSSSLVTPEKNSGKGKRKGRGDSSGDEEEPPLDRRRPSDLPRLIAIVFSAEFWEGICRSEQGSNNRSSNKRESNLLKDRHPIWRKVAAAYLDPGWKDQGSLPSHPVDHASVGCDGDTDMELEIKSLVRALEDVDYICPAERWRSILRDDEGDIDMVNAGSKFHGWWKFLRGELREVRRKEDKSGNHGRHSWRFCNKKVTGQLMLDFIDRSGGDEGNEYAKEYLDAELDEDSGAAFNSLNDEEDDTSDDEDDEDGEDGEDDEDDEDGDSRGRRRKKRRKKSPSRRRAVKRATVMEAIEKGGRQMKETGDAMVREMQRSAEPSVSDLLDQISAVSKDLALLEGAIATLEADPERSDTSLGRKKEQLAMTLATYEKLKVQHGRAMCRTYDER